MRFCELDAIQTLKKIIFCSGGQWVPLAMLSVHEIFLRLTVAAVLGAVIGIERDLNRRPAGVRTSLFVCLATALFTILSDDFAHRFGATGSTQLASNIV